MTSTTAYEGNAPPACPPTGGGPGEAVDLGALARAMWRGMWIIGLASTLTLFAGAYYVFVVATPLYRSTAVIILETRRQSVADLQSVIGGLTGDATEVNSEAEVLRSRELMGRVVETLDLAADPEFSRRPLTGRTVDALGRRIVAIAGTAAAPPAPPPADNAHQRYERAVTALINKVRVRNVPLSLVFKVTAQSENPAKSALIADTVARLYIRGQVEAKHDATEQAKEWLRGQVAELKAELERAEAAEAGFSADTELVSAEALEALERRLKELRERIGKAESAAHSAKAKYDALTTARSGQDQAALAGDPELHRLLIQTGAGGTKSAAFDSRLSQVLDRARGEVSRAEHQLATLRRSEAELDAQLARQGEDLITLQQLVREAEATRVLYEHFLTRFKETAAQQGLQRADSRILSHAVLPVAPASPRIPLVLAMSLLFGLTAGAGLVLLKETGHRGFRTARELENQTGLPVLGKVPRPVARPWRRRSGRAGTWPGPGFSLLMAGTDTPPGVILATSSVPGEGKTSTALALVDSFTGWEKSVLLICADSHDTPMTPGFVRGSGAGLASVLAGETTLAGAVCRPDGFGADILTARPVRGDGAGPLVPGRFRDLVTHAREGYDVVIIDAPPVLAAPDACIAARMADAVILTVGCGITPRRQVDEALRLFRASGCPVTGFTLSQSEPRRPPLAGRRRHMGPRSSRLGVFPNG